MKTKSYLILFLVLIVSFSFTNSESEKLSSISWCRELVLSQTDSKCGEWGGDTEIVRVYQKNCSGNILIDYSVIIMDCSDPIKQYSENKDVPVKTIIVDKELETQIEQCVLELTKMKLNNSNYIEHSGIINSVIYSDSTLIIKDYPSKKWLTFENLAERIKTKTVGNTK